MKRKKLKKLIRGLASVVIDPHSKEYGAIEFLVSDSEIQAFIHTLAIVQLATEPDYLDKALSDPAFFVDVWAEIQSDVALLGRDA